MRNAAAKRFLWWGIGLLLAALAALGGHALHQLLGAGTGIMAKNLCSAIYVSERDPNAAITQDSAQYPNIFSININEVDRTINVSAGWRTASASYHPGLGCIRRVARQTGAPGSHGANATWNPSGFRLAPSTVVPTHLPPPSQALRQQINMAQLNATLAQAFNDAPDTDPRLTRAVVVLWRGMLLAERYAEGITPSMPLTGWSMSKSLTSALVGLRVLDGALTLHQTQLLPQWQSPQDPRSKITLDALLRMSSGLAFNEDYFSTNSDAVSMLFGDGGADMAGFAASQPMAFPMDTHFAYSSGTSNILQRIVRNTFATTNDYLSYVQQRLLAPLGMQHTQLEPDMSGTLVGSSFGYASARDWAKFGLLYLQQGQWQGQRLLPPDWVSYSTTPSTTAPQGNYGAQWWLNQGSTAAPEDRPWPTLPRDAYRASGFEGQSLMIVPSSELVIVRLGLTVYPAEFDIEDFAKAIIETLP